MGEPPFRFGIIVCAMRAFGTQSSEWYGGLMRQFSETPRKQIFRMASLELARAAVRCRDELDMPIVAFDLAGQEDGFPARDHAEAYQYAHRHFLKKTVHAGEAYGPESIFEAITELHADRIGHGYHLFSPDCVAQDQQSARLCGPIGALHCRPPHHDRSVHYLQLADQSIHWIGGKPPLWPHAQGPLECHLVHRQSPAFEHHSVARSPTGGGCF